MSLNNNQVQLIETDVKNAGLRISALHEELVDHICCEVEALMENGKDFSEAYAIIKSQVSIDVMQNIEKNTLMLIDKKYANMRTFMKLSGNISLAFIVAGTLMKIYSIAGANIILYSGFFILCIVFIPSLIYSSFLYPEKNKSSLFKISALTGIILFAGGILLKVMEWSGANILLSLAYILILLISLPALIFDISKYTTDVSVKRINTFGVISLMVFILSTMFKMFHLPGAAILMMIGAIMLGSVSLPAITYVEFKRTGEITGRFIFIIILSIYVLTMSMLISFQSSPVIQDLISNR